MAACIEARTGTKNGGNGNMREVEWTDKDGFRHRSLVRDTDPDSAAPSGILKDPPDLDGLD